MLQVKDILAKGGDLKNDGKIHSKCFIIYAQSIAGTHEELLSHRFYPSYAHMHTHSHAQTPSGIEELLTLNLVDQLA
jgi:hypothetical protein